MTEEDQASPSSTIPADLPPSSNRVEQAIHGAAFSLVGLAVVLGSTGLLGVWTGQVSAEGSGFRMEITRALVTRPGLATPFRVDVFAEEGSDLPETITLVLDADYLAIFDFNGLQPTPSTTFSRGRSTWWTFEVPPGQSSLRVEVDARLEPAVQWARQGTVALEVDGESVVSAGFTTLVMP